MHTNKYVFAGEPTCCPQPLGRELTPEDIDAIIGNLLGLLMLASAETFVA